MIDAILRRAKKDIYSQKSALHLSKKIGEGYDFAELALYQYGDDAKKIDSKSTARTQIPHIKRYFEEKEANITIVPVLSSTLGFLQKMEIFYELLALLGYSVIKSSNPLNVTILNGKEIKRYKKSKNPAIVRHFIKDISNIKISKDRPDLKKLSKNIKDHPSLILIVGDFLDPIDLKELSKRDDLFVFIIRDEFEEHPKPLGEREFIDLGTLKSSTLFFGKKEMQKWKDGYERSDKKLFSNLKKASVSYIKIVGNEGILRQLKSFS